MLIVRKKGKKKKKKKKSSEQYLCFINLRDRIALVFFFFVVVYTANYILSKFKSIPIVRRVTTSWYLAVPTHSYFYSFFHYIKKNTFKKKKIWILIANSSVEVIFIN